MLKISATMQMKELMLNYFQRLDDFAISEKKKVAWCTSVGPAELLRSFDFEVYFPENHGALLGATRTAGTYIPDTVKIGYSGDICSYLTSDIGAYLNKKTPLIDHYGMKGIPKPDIIVYNTNQCREVQEWFTWFANEMKCPVAGVHPPRHLDEVGKEDIENVSTQFKNLIPACEITSGKKFDIDKFRNTVRLSREAAILWRKVLETSKNHPAPLSFFDGCIHMGPIVVLRGTQEAVDYYKLLYNELAGYVTKGKGFTDNESCRIFWDGMPIWGKLRMMSDLFANNNANVVASTYCNSWVFDTMDEKKPFESTALAYNQIFINRSEKAKIRMLTDMVKEYQVDGIIFHDARTCFNNSNARFGMPQRMQSDGIPSMIIEGDLCDLRFFSEGQTITKIESFIEQLVDLKMEVGSEI